MYSLSLTPFQKILLFVRWLVGCFGSIQHLAQLNSTRLASSRIWPGSAWINAVDFASSNEKVKKRFPFPIVRQKGTQSQQKELLYQITKRLKLYNNRIVKQTEASSSYFMFYWSFPLCYCSIEDFCRLFTAIEQFMHFFFPFHSQIKRKLTQSYWHWPPQSCWIFYIHSSPVCECTFEIRELFKIIFIFKWKFHATHTRSQRYKKHDTGKKWTWAKSIHKFVHAMVENSNSQHFNFLQFKCLNIYVNRKE